LLGPTSHQTILKQRWKPPCNHTSQSRGRKGADLALRRLGRQEATKHNTDDIPITRMLSCCRLHRRSFVCTSSSPPNQYVVSLYFRRICLAQSNPFPSSHYQNSLLDNSAVVEDASWATTRRRIRHSIRRRIRHSIRRHNLFCAVYYITRYLHLWGLIPRPR